MSSLQKMRLLAVAIVFAVATNAITVKDVKQRINSLEKAEGPTYEDFVAKACWPWSANCEEKAKDLFKEAMNKNLVDFDPEEYAKEMQREMEERTRTIELAAAQNELAANEQIDAANAKVGFTPGSTDWTSDQENWARSVASLLEVAEGEDLPKYEDFVGKACWPWSSGCEAKAKELYQQALWGQSGVDPDFDAEEYQAEMQREQEERARAIELAAAENEKEQNERVVIANEQVGFEPSETDWTPDAAWANQVTELLQVSDGTLPKYEDFVSKACWPWAAGCEDKAKKMFKEAMNNNVDDFNPEEYAKEMQREMDERSRATELAAAANEVSQNERIEASNKLVGFQPTSTDWTASQANWGSSTLKGG